MIFSLNNCIWNVHNIIIFIRLCHLSHHIFNGFFYRAQISVDTLPIISFYIKMPVAHICAISNLYTPCILVATIFSCIYMQVKCTFMLSESIKHLTPYANTTPPPAKPNANNIALHHFCNGCTLLQFPGYYHTPYTQFPSHKHKLLSVPKVRFHMLSRICDAIYGLVPCTGPYIYCKLDTFCDIRTFNYFLV